MFVIQGCKIGEDSVVVIAPLPSGNVGSTTVDLSASRSIVRKQEALLGNVIADALKAFAQSKGVTVDFAFMNGGGIRFDSTVQTDGIYPAGDISEGDTQAMLPFGNTGVVVTVTATQLRSILERSVIALDTQGNLSNSGNAGTGAFLQVSQGISFTVDPSQPAQVFSDTGSGIVVVTEGSRIRSLKVNGADIVVNGAVIVPDTTFKLIAPSFIAFGGDSYAAFKAIPDNQKTDFGEDMAISLATYFRNNSPVSPLIEGRIIINTVP